ncbi:MAG TPA: hypothetical protein VIK12_10165 [Pengzhenrongella sp.]
MVIVAGAILLLNRPGPTPVVSPSPTATASPSLDVTTAEGAVRSFFGGFAEARRTDDPTLVAPFVTGKDSSAYRSVAAFLQGQKDVGKASVTTVLRLENVQVQPSDSTASVSFDYTEGGYNIDPKTGQALESPVVLPTTKVIAVVRQVGGRWLVESYETR